MPDKEFEPVCVEENHAAQQKAKVKLNNFGIDS
jgi:hypothetical protein